MSGGAAVLGLAALGVAAGYLSASLIAVIAWRVRMRARAPNREALAPVTILKPLCGAEPGLYEHLRTFFRQDYPDYQIVCGVRDPADPALAIVERLRAEFPAQAIEVVVDPRQHGNNMKSSNLINMVAHARHDLLAIADSDTWVEPDYLAAVTAPLENPDVGLVTCLYRDVPTGGVWSRLGAMYINEWYAPSVLLARLFGHESYASGQTLCLRRDTLERIGGLAATANHLADDYRLGELVRASGLRIVLSAYEVKAEHDEPTLGSLVRHERRWMRTLRVLRPRSFALLFMSFGLPLAAAGLLLAVAAGAAPATAWTLFALALAARLAIHIGHRLGGSHGGSYGGWWRDLWLLPLRDSLLCAVWAGSFFGSRIIWRGSVFDVDAQGVMHRIA